MLLLPMGEDTGTTFRRCSCHGLCGLRLNGNRFNDQMYFCTDGVVGSTFAITFWGALLLVLFAARHSVAYDAMAMAMSSSVHADAVSVHAHDFDGAALYEEASVVVRVSTSDLQQRKDLERNIQLAAFQQYDSRRTGQIYNVSVLGFSPGDVRAVRLRSGSFRRYGVDISEFNIPRGCYVDPIPERILLVYTRFSNISLFQSVPAGYAVAAPVLSVLVYDAANLRSSEPPDQLSVSITVSPISIGFSQSIGSRCAYFPHNTTDVNIFNSSQGVCQVDHLGTFAILNRALAPSPAPNEAQLPPTRQKKQSNTWKIVLGSVIGGAVLLALVVLLAWGIGKRRNEAKLSKMEYQTEQGETLQMATIRNSRVPTATNTRTQATLVNDYTV